MLSIEKLLDSITLKVNKTKIQKKNWKHWKHYIQIMMSEQVSRYINYKHKWKIEFKWISVKRFIY